MGGLVAGFFPQKPGNAGFTGFFTDYAGAKEGEQLTQGSPSVRKPVKPVPSGFWGGEARTPNDIYGFTLTQ
jgi:hypothetical protein